MVREYTDKLIEYTEEELLTWENIARAALCYMSEDDVKDMALTNCLIEEDEVTE